MTRQSARRGFRRDPSRSFPPLRRLRPSPTATRVQTPASQLRCAPRLLLSRYACLPRSLKLEARLTFRRRPNPSPSPPPSLCPLPLLPSPRLAKRTRSIPSISHSSRLPRRRPSSPVPPANGHRAPLPSPSLVPVPTSRRSSAMGTRSDTASTARTRFRSGTSCAWTGSSRVRATSGGERLTRGRAREANDAHD